MSDATTTKYVFVKLADSALYAAMLTSQTAAATSATNAAASAASAASAATTVVNSRVAGTTNNIAKFTGANAVGNSLLSDDGTTVSVAATYLQLSNAAPSLVFYESDGATDAKRWQLSANSGILTLYTTNDANNASAAAWQVTRSGNSITQHQWFVGGNSKFRISSASAQGVGTMGSAGAASLVAMSPGLAQGELAGYSFHTTFVGTGDNGPRRTADIWAGKTGGWGTEYLSFAVGTGAANETAALTTERVRIYGDGGMQIGGTFGTSPGAGALKLGGNGSIQSLWIVDTSASTGANIRLDGDGATTPSKYIRAKSGNLEIANSAYSAVIATLTDAGIFTASGFKIGANQVVGARDAGWAAMTGTANKATVYDTSTVTLAQLAGRVMSLQAALTTHGLLGA